MEQINPSKWSPEWYESTTEDELVVCVTEAKEALKHLSRTKDRSLWQGRLQKLEGELAQRQSEEEPE